MSKEGETILACLAEILNEWFMCPSLCDTLDYSLPGSYVHGISQARILEWVVMPSSRGSSPPRILNQHLSCLYGKESTCNARDLCLIPGYGRSPEEVNGYPLQYSSLGNPMDRGAWWATVNEVTKSRT